MIPVSQDEIHHFSDGTSLIHSSVNIVNRNGFGELPSVEPVTFGIVAVNELSSGSAVHERVDGLHFPVSVVSSSTFSLREVELSSADAIATGKILLLNLRCRLQVFRIKFRKAIL